MTFGDSVVSAQVDAVRRRSFGVLAIALITINRGARSAQRDEVVASHLNETAPRRDTISARDLMTMSDQETSAAEVAEMSAASKLTTKVLAIGTWTANATPATRPPIMPSEARDTMRLMLAGKIDQWFAKIDGSGAVFLMNVTDPAEAHALLEKLPLGQADMMRFQLIPLGPLWPLGLLIREPAK
jgi:hypothetical protein